MSDLKFDTQSTKSGGEVVEPGVDLGTQPVSTKTPFFQAIHALRYQRQALIHQTQERTRRKLICYISGSGASIERDDTIGFGDLLHSVPPNKDLDLMLHTGGGDIDAAEKLISMVRKHVGVSTLRIIVPDYAKSAGTLIALGADYIVMSDTSELGPIDPQVLLSDGNGNRIWHSVQSYLDAYKTYSEALTLDPNDIAARIMIQKLEPATVQQFQVIMIRARKLAENQLQHWMFRKGGNFTQAAAELIDTTRWQSHGQMITWEDAQDPKIGLSVEYQHPQSLEWQEYWQLYCLQRLAIQDNQKLFESDHVSLTIDGHR